MRRKRLKSGNGSGSGSSDEHRRLSKMRSRSAGNPRSSSSDLTTSGTSTAYSSSDMSCDTVVYRDRQHRTIPGAVSIMTEVLLRFLS